MRNLLGDHIVAAAARRRRGASSPEGEIRRLEAEVARLRREVEVLSEYRRLAYHDDLTGLRNRRYFDERLREELSRSERAGMPCSVISVDIDRFKEVNDRHGHFAGDQVLCGVGRMLQTHKRAIDIACRVGGDEFAVILPLTGREGALSVLSRLEAAQRSVILPHGGPVRLSLGLATYPDEAQSAEGLIVSADRGMYAVKRSRNPG